MKVYTSPPPKKNPDREALDHAHAAMTRARAEVSALACIARLGRRGLAMARAAGVTAGTMTADDTRAIMVALEMADAEGCDYFAAARLTRLSLRAAGCWDDGDTRPYATGMMWSLAALAELFRGMAATEAETGIDAVLAALTPTRQGVAA